MIRISAILRSPALRRPCIAPPPARWSSTLPTGSAPSNQQPTPAPQHASLLAKVDAATLPYRQLARLDKPAGTYLLYLPCTWSILLASATTTPVMPALATAKLLALFGTGAFIMRGAGCTINDLWDRDFDRRVERTRTRPLASGAITVPQAVGFLGLQLSAGLAVLTQLNWTSIAVGASSLALVVTYPLMKRVTYYPQLFLGLTFNWGALLGFTAVNPDMFPILTALPLYGAGICWTLVYDTLYAHQDKRDDIAVGVKSTALAFGDDRTKPVLTALSLTAGGLLVAAGLNAGLGAAYYAGAASAVANMLYVTHRADLSDPASCWWAFHNSSWAGVMLALGLGVEYGRRLLTQDEEKSSLMISENKQNLPQSARKQ